MPRDPARFPLDDRIRAIHMLEAASQARQYSCGRARVDLDADTMLRRALIHCVQEIGEAASKIGEAGRTRFAGVQWRQIVGMRHRLVHDYMVINLDLLWLVVQNDLGPLIAALHAGLAAWPSPPTSGRPPAPAPPAP